MNNASSNEKKNSLYTVSAICLSCTFRNLSNKKINKWRNHLFILHFKKQSYLLCTRFIILGNLKLFQHLYFQPTQTLCLWSINFSFKFVALLFCLAKKSPYYLLGLEGFDLRLISRPTSSIDFLNLVFEGNMVLLFKFNIHLNCW